MANRFSPGTLEIRTKTHIVRGRLILEDEERQFGNGSVRELREKYKENSNVHMRSNETQLILNLAEMYGNEKPNTNSYTSRCLDVDKNEPTSRQRTDAILCVKGNTSLHENEFLEQRNGLCRKGQMTTEISGLSISLFCFTVVCSLCNGYMFCSLFKRLHGLWQRSSFW